MQELNLKAIDFNTRKLLFYATSEKNVDRECELYQLSPARKLYGFFFEGNIIGCIGIEFNDAGGCEIKHLAVSPKHRGEGVGSKMIRFIQERHSLTSIFAETDQDAVNFYKKIGFVITSLGEKYPGVERFRCKL